jgi:hypothetical protein
LLIEGDGDDEGDVDMAVRREKRDQREQAAQEQGDPNLNVEQKTLPTPSSRRSINNTPVPISDSRAGCQSSGADLWGRKRTQPKRLPSGFQEAAGVKRRSHHTGGREAAFASAPRDTAGAGPECSRWILPWMRAPWAWEQFSIPVMPWVRWFSFLVDHPSSKPADFLQQGHHISNSLGVGFAGFELVAELDEIALGLALSSDSRAFSPLICNSLCTIAYRWTFRSAVGCQLSALRPSPERQRYKEHLHAAVDRRKRTP